ncbi:MAG: class I SAM-dependent methyltransferase [Chloroflexi bacterium]|nr:class I SAM-dependent methyltransferase [Chloroflexota bacterium]
MKNENFEAIASLASGVKGFLADDEGRALYDMALTAAKLGPCLEIGSFCGMSTVYLGAACKKIGSTLFSIDHHQGSEEQQPGQPYFDPDLLDSRTDNINSFPLLRETLKKADLENNVVPMVTRSGVAARNWATPLGLVFIDGGHSYETALADYRNWSPHLLPGGSLIFHDIYTDPAKGGQAPSEVYKLAMGSGNYTELPMVNSLGILRKLDAVVVEKKVCC